MCFRAISPAVRPIVSRLLFGRGSETGDRLSQICVSHHWPALFHFSEARYWVAPLDGFRRRNPLVRFRAVGRCGAELGDETWWQPDVADVREIRSNGRGKRSAREAFTAFPLFGQSDTGRANEVPRHYVR